MLRRFLKISLLSLALAPTFGLAKAPSLPCQDQEAEALRTSQLMSGLLSFPTIPYMIGNKDGMAAFVPTSEVFAAVLGTSAGSALINHVEELRFLPNTLSKASVLLVLSAAEGFAADDAAKAAAVAAELELTISLVWLSEELIPQTLIKLVKDSRGASFDRDELVRKVFAYGCPAE